MRRIIPLTAIACFILFFLADVFLSGCATRSTPSGGPRDTSAPVVDTSYPPNRSLFFEGSELIIEFDEYISLKNPGQQISFSPPLKKKPEFSLKGKELSIEWSDTLRPNTTYTISFGDAIRDYTEGNVNDQLKFVFSTGSYIDSLHLKGRVIDGRTGKPEKQFLVALYDQEAINENDSLAYNGIPAYYTYTDEEGNYELENLRYHSFHVIAFEDKRGNFQLNTGSEKMAFLSDSLILNDSTPSLTLKTFNPQGERRFFGARHIAYGQVQIDFNYPPDSLEVTRIITDSLGTNDYLTWDDTPDTSIFWFDQGKLDSIILLVKTAELADTSTIYLRPFKRQELKIEAESESVPFYQNPTFNTDKPIGKIDPSKILTIAGNDTLASDSAFIASPTSIEVIPVKRPGQFQCYFMKGAVTSFDNDVNDSLLINITNLRRNELGSVLFRVVSESEDSLILLIHNENGEETARLNFSGTTSIDLKNERPGLYSAEIIIDENGDGKWTTGDYLSRRKPERIVKYSEKIEVRANWELELVWEADLGK